jgi:hypothetical protein
MNALGINDVLPVITCNIFRLKLSKEKTWVADFATNLKSQSLDLNEMFKDIINVRKEKK